MIEPEPKSLGPRDPRRIGPYRLMGVIGEGGMGRVYLGTSTGRIRAAVKVMHQQLVRDASFRERFRREVTLAKRVSGRFTARILDSGVDDEIPWLATEYISGPTLEQAVAQRGELTEGEVLVLAAQLGQALRDIHAKQVIHRDLKPSNIICSPDGARVIDFGIARALDGSTVTKQLVGTPGYMSPEHLANRPVSQAGDVFSLGCVLVYAATQRHPERISAGANHSAEIELRDVPYRLRELIGSCVQESPERRPTVDQLIRQVAGLGHAGGGNWPAGRFPPPHRTRQFQDARTITAMQLAFHRIRNRRWLSGIGPWCGRVVRSYRLTSAKLRTASLHWPLLGATNSLRWSRWCMLLSSLSLVEVASRTAQVQSTAHGPLPWLPTALQVQSAIKQFTNWIPDPVSQWALSAGTASRTDDRLAIVTGTLLLLMLIARRSHRNYLHQVAIKALATYAGTAVMLLIGARLLQTGFGPIIHIAEYLRWWALPSLLAAAVLIYPLSRAPGDKPVSR